MTPASALPACAVRPGPVWAVWAVWRVWAVWPAARHAATAVMAFDCAARIAAACLPAQALAHAVVPMTLLLSCAMLFVRPGPPPLGTLREVPQNPALGVVAALGTIGRFA